MATFVFAYMGGVIGALLPRDAGAISVLLGIGLAVCWQSWLVPWMIQNQRDVIIERVTLQSEEYKRLTDEMVSKLDEVER